MSSVDEEELWWKAMLFKSDRPLVPGKLVPQRIEQAPADRFVPGPLEAEPPRVETYTAYREVIIPGYTVQDPIPGPPIPGPPVPGPPIPASTGELTCVWEVSLPTSEGWSGAIHGPPTTVVTTHHEVPYSLPDPSSYLSSLRILCAPHRPPPGRFFGQEVTANLNYNFQLSTLSIPTRYSKFPRDPPIPTKIPGAPVPGPPIPGPTRFVPPSSREEAYPATRLVPVPPAPGPPVLIPGGTPRTIPAYNEPPIPDPNW